MDAFTKYALNYLLQVSDSEGSVIQPKEFQANACHHSFILAFKLRQAIKLLYEVEELSVRK